MSETPIFDALYQGPSNRFACAALNVVANTPGGVYNPLWLYGPSGTGKTALLSATAAALRDHPSRPLILRIDAEQLVHDMIRAIEHRSTEEFRARILGFQVILVDHADYLDGRCHTQAQVGLLLGEAVRLGTQVLLASSCGPAVLEDLEQKFQTYCPWLLHCDLPLPPPEERLVITRHMARERALPLSERMACQITHATQTPAQIRCIIHHLSARRKLLQLEEAGLSAALDHLLEREVCV